MFEQMDWGNFCLLDHGYVTYVAHMGTDLDPCRSARMSTSNPTGVDEAKDKKLLDRLWRDQHSSCFECCELMVDIQAPLFVLRQMDRHRTVSLDQPEIVETYDEWRKFSSRNEFSGRYSEMPDIAYLPGELRVQNEANKQCSSQQRVDGEEALERMHEGQGETQKLYRYLLSQGVSRESARMVLPLAQYTRIRLKANLLNWFKLLNLRLRLDVQRETRLYAVAIGRVCRHLWPKCWDVFEEHTLYAQTFSRKEMRVLNEIFAGTPEQEKALQKLATKPVDLLDENAQ